SGIKTFELRKDPNLEGINELVVIEHICSNDITNRDNCDYANCPIITDDCISDRLTVKMTKKDLSVYEIVRKINQRLNWILNLVGYAKLSIEENKEMLMLINVDKFLIEYTKDNKPFYWYDVEIIKE
ncbi:hypothetical protein, partial [Mesoplasma melaleucae]